jgi:hypothetical protein
MYKRCRMKQGRRQQCNKMYNMGYREFLEYTATEESNLSLATMVIGTRRERVCTYMWQRRERTWAVRDHHGVSSRS